MNIRHALHALSISVLAGLASCDKDSKVFSDADLSTEHSTVSGRVTGLRDSGVVGIVVTAVAVDAKGAPLADVATTTALTGDDGRYSLQLRPGLRWSVSWQSPDYQTSNDASTFDLGLRETKDLGTKRLTYRFGWLKGRTFPGAAIAIDGQDASTRADANGRFRLERVVPGDVEIVGIVHGKGCWRTTATVRAESDDSITAPQLSDEAQLSRLSTLSGTLANQDGTPQAGAILFALGGLVRDTADVHGGFRLGDLPANGKVVVTVSRGVGSVERMVLATPPADSSWDLGSLPVTGSVTGAGVYIGNGLVVADSGTTVPVPLLWKLLDTTRTVLCFAWDTTGAGSIARARRTQLPRLPAIGVGASDRTISVWVCVAAPLSSGGFDTLWSSEATIRVMVRRKAPPPDSAMAPEFSHDDKSVWNAPLRIGLATATEGATVLWSRDNSHWKAWSDDSIILHDTTTIWAFSRLSGKLDSRIVRKTFNVRESAKPETLNPSIEFDTELPQGSIWEAYECPTLSPGVKLTLDSGASLTLKAGCQLAVDDDASLELRAGSSLILHSGSIKVGDVTSGSLIVDARSGRRASIRSFNLASPAGYYQEYLVHLGSKSGGSSIRGLDLNGSSGSGILITDAEVDVIDSRIRNCKVAGIEYTAAGRPATPDGVRDDSISDCRWSVTATPYALGRIAYNPGFQDTVLVNSTSTAMAGGNTWRRQNLPLRVETNITVDNGASLVLSAGLHLRMLKDQYIKIVSGRLDAAGTRDAPVRIEPTGMNWGYYEEYGILFQEDAQGELRWIEVLGSKGSGVLVDGEIGVHDSRFDSNAVAGIQFRKGRPDGDTSFARVSATGNRWSLQSSPRALARIASCPGLSDTILLSDDGDIEGNARWSRQKAPVLVNGFGLAVQSDASLTIDSGSTYVFMQGSYIDVGNNGGTLVVAGTASSPVQFLPRTATGWGYYPNTTDGHCLEFSSETTSARLSHLILKGAQSNGIVFNNTLPGIGALDSVTVVRTASPTTGTSGLLIDGNAPTIVGYTCDDGGAGGCP